MSAKLNGPLSGAVNETENFLWNGNLKRTFKTFRALFNIWFTFFFFLNALICCIKYKHF